MEDTNLADMAEEFDTNFEKARQSANDRPWARPARLPEHPHTRSDRHPDDPEHDEMFAAYF